MKKDLIAVPLLPFTDDEEAALVEKLTAMDTVALGHYVDSARLSLANKALDASWKPRIAIGLSHAEAVLLSQSLMAPADVAPLAVEPADAAALPAPTAKAAKAPKARPSEA